jgi:hypothetical protein
MLLPLLDGTNSRAALADKVATELEAKRKEPGEQEEGGAPAAPPTLQMLEEKLDAALEGIRRKALLVG